MLNEREAIILRIGTLEREMSKEQADLAALDIILARLDPAPQRTAPSKDQKRSVDFVDADFEIIAPAPHRG